MPSDPKHAACVRRSTTEAPEGASKGGWGLRYPVLAHRPPRTNLLRIHLALPLRGVAA